MKNNKLSYSFIISLFLLLVIFQPVSAQEIPTDIKSKIDSGVAAAETGDWEEALYAFHNASALLHHRKIRIPPELMFNFALASDKSPGRLLAASAWYRAYLAAVPDDANAGQIQQRADELIKEYDKIIWPRVREMEEVIKESIQNIPADFKQIKNSNSFGPMGKSIAFSMAMRHITAAVGDIAAARINMGDLSGIDKVPVLMRGLEKHESYDLAYRSVIGALAGTGEYKKAKELLTNKFDSTPSERAYTKDIMDGNHGIYKYHIRLIQGCDDPATMWTYIAIGSGNQGVLGMTDIPPGDSEEFIGKFKNAIAEEENMERFFSKISAYADRIKFGTAQRLIYKKGRDECNGF